ncbi:adenylate isopentenyltransferase 5, chloroplastic-like [Olea europaea var. sylvestris]|uniref:adenylate dimethylallyltransferase (ADP/ATP-dependent) n=1 Tax=Olea europaea subsp. europaea TaxID=158383 RepID=A0A8S0S8V4_OLEEU|nr:adenylate isopentenyltransferase 5, chloroplastic-like [Olea europaea var. sylvestris]CAA2988548.1 adenylate isopentenyltransferase 5, chloroplastic-like [Olea europaea subsp. europaea]
MRISFSACKPAQPLQVNFPGGLNMDQFIPGRRRKDKVVIVMGATGTGKSRLSIDLATRFEAEIVNSDKMQVYKGLNIVTNKVTEEECRGIPHHLLGIVDPDADFAAVDFVHHASTAVDSITRRGKLPIIAGGSNSYIKALVNDDMEFQSKYECCFLWVNVSMAVLHSFLSKRVDRMVDTSLINEARDFFDPEGNYTRGIKRAIGVPELHEFFQNESILDYEARARLLEDAIDKIKANNCKLASNQLQNIVKLRNQLEWHMYNLDATEAFLKRGLESDEAWEMLVARPATRIVGRFLCKDDMDFMSIAVPPPLYQIIETTQSILS